MNLHCPWSANEWLSWLSNSDLIRAGDYRIKETLACLTTLQWSHTLQDIKDSIQYWWRVGRDPHCCGLAFQGLSLQTGFTPLHIIFPSDKIVQEKCLLYDFDQFLLLLQLFAWIKLPLKPKCSKHFWTQDDGMSGVSYNHQLSIRSQVLQQCGLWIQVEVVMTSQIIFK